MGNELTFSTQRACVPVKIDNEEYVLKEATGSDACIYRNAMLNSTTLGTDGKPTGLKDFANVEPLLVSLCLYNSEDRRVTLEAVNTWPSKIIKSLYAKAKEISELDETEEDDEAAKNDQSDTTDG